MKKSYHTIGKQGKVNEQELAGFLARNGQFLLPMVDLIEQCRLACDELIDVTGRAAIEAVLQLSAEQAAGGPAQQGKRRAGDVVFYGQQPGQVMLSDRKLAGPAATAAPKGPGRVKKSKIPAYAAMQEPARLGAAHAGHSDARRLHAQLQGGDSGDGRDRGGFEVRVSRQTIEASEAEVEALLNRRFDEVKLLVIYIDGIVFGDHTMIGAVGVDTEGNKHVLGIREGATENSTVVKELLEDIVARGRQSGAEAAVCHRRIEGAAGRHQRGFRRSAAGATLPRA